MNNDVYSKIWASLSLTLIFFIPCPTAFTETVDQETKSSVKFLADSPIHPNFLAYIVTDDEVDLPVHLLPVYPNDETNLEFRLTEQETSTVILLSESESESESSLPCNWEWWEFNNPNCVPSNSFFDRIAASDTVCLKNCGRGTESYRKVCVSYDPDEEDPQILTPHIWFRHGCTNCSPPETKDGTSSFRLDSLLLPAVETSPKGRSLGRRNGNVFFGLDNPSGATYVKSAAQIEGYIRTPAGRIEDTKDSFIKEVEVASSNAREDDREAIYDANELLSRNDPVP